LYVLVNYISGKFEGGIYLVNTIAGFIFLYGYIRFCLKQDYPFISFLIGVPYLVIVVAMGYTRQSIAIGFIFLVYIALIESKYLKAVILNIFAVLSHKTAVVIFPLIIIHYLLSKKISLKQIIAILIITSISFIVTEIFFLPHFEYFTHTYVEAKMQSSGGFLRILMNIIPASLYLLFYRRIKSNTAEKKLWLIISIFIVILFLVQILGYSTVIDRLALYFTPIQMVVYGKLIKILRGTITKELFILALILGYLTVLFAFLNYAKHRDAWVPYRNIILEQII
jgi:hypothetical protein